MKQKTIDLVNPELKPSLAEMKNFDLRDETLAESRQMFEKSMSPSAPPTPDVSVRERKIPARDKDREIKVFIYTPENQNEPLPTILHIHGGGMVAGSPLNTDGNNRQIARDVNCVIVSVEYRLSPEARFPQAIEDCYDALLWLHSHAADLGVDSQRIAVMGESAGGGLAASLAILARDRGEIAVVFQMLVYAMLDYKTGSTLEKNPNEFTGEFVWTRQNNAYGWSSLLGADYESQTVSPYASASQAEDLSGLPPAFLAVGSLDLFVDENLEYAHRLIRAGVATELHIFPGAFHGFDMIAGTSLAETLHRQQKEALKTAFSAK